LTTSTAEPDRVDPSIAEWIEKRHRYHNRDTESTNIQASIKMAMVNAIEPEGAISVATITLRSSGMENPDQ